MLDWHYPWLLLLALQPFVLLLLRLLKTRRLVDRYASRQLQPWVTTGATTSLGKSLLSRNTLYILAWLLFAIAAAGPRVAIDAPGFDTASGRDIVTVVDLSQSMQASDVGQSRLQLARRKLEYLNQQAGSDRLAIIVFAAQPHVYVPLSHDRQAIRFYLDNLEQLKAPTQGSRPLRALSLATRLLTERDSHTQQRPATILLVTDGDFSALTREQVSSFVGQLTYPLDILLVASSQGEAVPGYQEGWLSEANQPVVSRPDRDLLDAFIAAGDGELIRGRGQHSDIDTYLSILDARGQVVSERADSMTNWQEQFPLFLLPAILLLFISLLPYRLPLKTGSVTGLGLLLLVGLLASPVPSHADTNHIRQLALAALQQDNYELARQYYDSLDGYHGQLGNGVVAYRLEDYPRAIRLFEQAVVSALTDRQRGKALFNLGNSQFMLGNYPAAVSSYEGALLYLPGHTATTANTVLAKRAQLAVEQQLARQGRTARAGRGPRSARAVEGIEIGEDTTVSIAGDGDDTPGGDTRARDATTELPEILVLRGLEYAESSGQVASSSAVNNRNRSSTLALRDVDRLQDNQAQLWQRIFEAEEGYAAPVEEPRRLPGLAPW